jgi:hypothetical protein
VLVALWRLHHAALKTLFGDVIRMVDVTGNASVRNTPVVSPRSTYSNRSTSTSHSGGSDSARPMSPRSSVLQSESCRVGLRTVEITTAGVLTVNDRRLTVRGVNLHEHDPVLGHVVTPQLLEADVLLMKRHNFNAVRTSHYPQQPWFYELCTGMYLTPGCLLGRGRNSLSYRRASVKLRVISMRTLIACTFGPFRGFMAYIP